MTRYALFETQLTSCEPGTHVALVQSSGTAHMDDVIDRIIQRGSTVTRADIAGVLEDYYAVIEHLLLEGQRVVTPVAHFGTSVRGRFTGPDDTSDVTRHQVAWIVNPGCRLRTVIQHRARVAKREATKRVPNPESFVDANTGEKNATLTPGGMGRLVGHRLKIADPDDPAQGVFFVDETNAQTRVSVIGENRPRSLIFLVPASLPTGQYRLLARSRFYENDLREGALQAALTVG